MTDFKTRREYTLIEPEFANLVYKYGRFYELDYVTKNLLECINFWRRQGAYMYASNLSKGYGSVASRKVCLNTTYPDWLLRMILSDAKAFCYSTEGQELRYSCSRTDSEVRILRGETVVLIISFNYEAYERL